MGQPLLRLSHRHDVAALRVVDAADDDLPDAGLIFIEDAETGEQFLVDSSDPLFRARLQDGVDERDADLTGRMRRAGVPLHRIGTDATRWTLSSTSSPRPGGGARDVDSPWWLLLGAVLVRVPCGRRRRGHSSAPDRPDGGRSRPGRGPARVAARVGPEPRCPRRARGCRRRPAASVPVTRAAGTVIVAVDVSNSMGATDVAPTRLDAAKKAATAFVEAQPSSVDIGVVAFENGGLTTDQPSADHAAAQAAIGRLRVTGGTSLADAILTSLSAITGKTVALGKDGKVPNIGYWGSATVVLFSDGEDRGSADATEAAADGASRPASMSRRSASVRARARPSTSTAIASTPRWTRTP